MSRLFGEMRQMGFVVPDLQKSMRHWSDVCAIGPWFWFEKSSFILYRYKGKVYDNLDVTVGFANSGEFQIELIQQRCNTPSMYRDFLARYPRGGLQHWSSWPVDYKARYDAALKAGYTIGMEGDHARGPFVYFDNEGDDLGSVIEMAELTQGRAKFFDMVREAAVGWDGRDPFRKM
jgi:hypothetical protein